MAGKSGPPSDNLFITGLPEGFDQTSLQTVLGAYGNIQQAKVMPPQPGKKAAAMVRFATVDEAKWIVENLNGNIPQGLTEPIDCKFAMSKDQKQGMDAGKGWGPYADGGKDGGWGKGKGVGKGKCSIRTLVDGLGAAGALPGAGQKGAAGNDENTLFVAGLPADTTDCDLYKIFAPFGALKSVKAMSDPMTGMCKGIGFVNCMDNLVAQMAIATLNGTSLPDGTWLTVSIKNAGGKGKDGDGGKGDGGKFGGKGGDGGKGDGGKGGDGGW